MNVALVIAHYDAPTEKNQRRSGHHESKRYYEIQKHFLKKVKHNCHVISVFAKDGLSEPILKSKNEKETIIHRPNIGMSHGSFFYVTSLFQDEFDYYIFIEDDYVFIKDNFDELLVKEFREDYTVLWLKNELRRAGHVVLSGITSKEVLKKYDYFKNVKFIPGATPRNMDIFCEAWNLPNGPFKGQFNRISRKDNIFIYLCDCHGRTIKSTMDSKGNIIDELRQNPCSVNIELMNGPLDKNKDINEQVLMIPTQVIDNDFNIDYDNIKRAPQRRNQHLPTDGWSGSYDDEDGLAS